MLILLSPAKTLDYENADSITNHSIPQFSKYTNQLIRILKKKSQDELKSLMHISDKLASLNRNRYKIFSKTYSEENSKASILAFKGDVYTGLDASSLTSAQLDFANKRVRILSGLYGILLPFDRMQPYRLEMGTKLETKKGTNLYHFWGDLISKSLNKDLVRQNTDVIINLASNEYFKVVDKKLLKARIVNIDFREDKNGELKFVSFFAKKARGLMTKYIIENSINIPEDLRGFDYENYRYEENASTKDKLLFVR